LPTFFASLCSLAHKIKKRDKKRPKNKTNKQRGWDKKNRVSKFLLPVKIGSIEICKKKKKVGEESTLQKFRKCSKFLFSTPKNFPIFDYQ